MEAISFSEQATAARRDYFAGSNSGVVGQDGQDARDVGDVDEKFAATPAPVAGNLPLRSVIVGVGPPSTSADFRGGLCYLDARHGIGVTGSRALSTSPKRRLPLSETGRTGYGPAHARAQLGTRRLQAIKRPGY
jgi:hypothetical protein